MRLAVILIPLLFSSLVMASLKTERAKTRVLLALKKSLTVVNWENRSSTVISEKLVYPESIRCGEDTSGKVSCELSVRDEQRCALGSEKLVVTLNQGLIESVSFINRYKCSAQTEIP